MMRGATGTRPTPRLRRTKVGTARGCTHICTARKAIWGTPAIGIAAPAKRCPRRIQHSPPSGSRSRGRWWRAKRMRAAAADRSGVFQPLTTLALNNIADFGPIAAALHTAKVPGPHESLLGLPQDVTALLRVGFGGGARRIFQ